MRECGTPVAAIAAQGPVASAETATNPQASFTDQLSQTPQLQSSGAKVIYAVNILNSYGRSAGLSNQVQVPAAPALPPPANLEAQLTADGVRLTWKPVAPARVVSDLRYAYRIYRRELGSTNDAVAGELPVADESEGSLLDHSFEWEKTYDYRASLVTFIAQGNAAEEQVEGEDTAPIRVVAHDVFPPAVPSGLQAVFSGPGQSPFIDLGWAPNTDSDLAGYNIYRHEQGAEPAKVNSEPVRVAAFRDSAVSSAHEYFYSVSAIDVRGNESARSEEASETAP
jgi:hypothetical protein